MAHYFQKGHFNAQFRQKGQKRSMNTWFWEKHVIASEAVVGLLISSCCQIMKGRHERYLLCNSFFQMYVTYVEWDSWKCKAAIRTQGLLII